jgi:hypothetical protein
MAALDLLVRQEAAGAVVLEEIITRPPCICAALADLLNEV